MTFSYLILVSLLCLTLATGSQQTAAGVHISIRGVAIANNSYVDIDSIGGDHNEGALLCHTDKTDCCTSTVSPNGTTEGSAGNWYNPDGVAIGSQDENEGATLGDMSVTTFAVSRGQNVVRLSRVNSSSRELGRFYCEVPDADGINQTLCAFILDIGEVTISPSGPVNKSVGEIFIPECSIDIFPYPLPKDVPSPTLEWSLGTTNIHGVVVSGVGSANYTYSSTLQFSPLQESHAGMYTCQLGNNESLADSINISTFPVQVRVSDGGVSPTVGQSYMLTCNVAIINVTIYQWRKNNEILRDEVEETLRFSMLSLSSAGQYTCGVAVESVTYTANNYVSISLHIPAPSSLLVESSKPNPIWPIGSNITLACTVQLSSAVDIPVIVTIVLSGPNRPPVMTDYDTAQPGVENNNTYTSTATVDSFMRIDSGYYTCTATIMAVKTSPYLNESGAEASDEIRLTTGVYLSLMGEPLANGSEISTIDIVNENTDNGDNGEDNSILVCHTDRLDCCDLNSFDLEGEWYLPGGVPVSDSKPFTVTGNDDGRINLNYANDNVMPQIIGLLCCTVLDAVNVNQTACVNVVPHVSIEISDGGTPPVVGRSYALHCNVSGMSVAIYQWWKDDEVLSETGSTLSFSPFRLSHAGRYSCNTTVANAQNKEITLHIPAPTSVSLKSNKPSPIWPGSEVGLMCSVELSPLVVESDLSVISVDAWLSRDGTLLNLTGGPTTAGTTFFFNIQLESFGWRDSGNYTCIGAIRSPSKHHLIDSASVMSNDIKVSTGVYLSLNGTVVANNSNIFITAIGEEDDGALLCFTDLHWCCNETSGHAKGAGEWYFPNKSAVENESSTSDIYRSRGPSVVRLHRRNNITMPTGVFHCEVPHANGIIQNIYVRVYYERTQTTVSSVVVVVMPVVGVLLLTVAGIVVTIFGIRRLKSRSKKYHVTCLNDSDISKTPMEVCSPNVGRVEYLDLKKLDGTQEDKHKENHFTDTSLFTCELEKPIPVSEFSRHVERLHADRDRLFEEEYTSISQHPHSSHLVAKVPHNNIKNRFADIFPYDFSRVKLKEIPEIEGSDYINASYLDGYKKPNAYIGTQGPMPNTVSDFWRMIWENKLPTVVMLTRCQEGKKKCEKYWPENVNESIEPGHAGLTVTLTSILPFAEYSVRKMALTSSAVSNSPPLEVTQFHFTGWPDHGVPQNGVILINFMKRVRAAHPYSDSRPLLVHCSAGVGRTGAFVVLDSMLERIKVEEDLNIFKFLKQLRTKRVRMVQTQAQYNFIHDALNELILCGDTEISAPNLRIVINKLSNIADGETGFDKQFSNLDRMSLVAPESDYMVANKECNASKNRYPNILPNDHYRVILRSSAASGSDYINASFIDGYRQRRAYIATQTPMENTVNDFWRMIWEYKSRSIVLLCRMVEDGQEQCHEYLPGNKGSSETYGKVTVNLVSQETSTDFIVRYLELSEDSPRSRVSRAGLTRAVTVFHYICWPRRVHGASQETSGLREFVEHINRSQMSSGNNPITVMCKDGVGRTGTFICIHAQLERLKTEGTVDFFQSVKSSRIQRAGLVPNVNQYIFCHSVVADYLDSFDTYANFKEVI